MSNKRPLVVRTGVVGELSDGDALRLPTFSSAPPAGANTNSIFLVGSALSHDNGSAVIPLDQQGDWAKRVITGNDTIGGGSPPIGVNENIILAKSASALTLAFVPSSTLRFPDAKLIDVWQVSAGTVTVTAPDGVTFVGPGVTSGNSVQTPGQGKALSFMQDGLDTWQVLGGGPPSALVTQSFDGSITDYSQTGQSNFNIGNYGFFTIPIADSITNIGTGVWDANQHTYTVPETGLYFVDGLIRPVDNAGSFNFGCGIHTANVDYPKFRWRSIYGTPGGSSSNREHFAVSGVRRYVAGQALRFYGYVDANFVPGFNSAYMTILLLQRTA